MIKDEFIKLMEGQKEWYSRVNEVSDILGIDNIFELNWVERTGVLFDWIIQHNFTEAGQDWIFWWLFEKNSSWSTDNKAFDKDGNEIPTETIDDLWNLVKEELI